MRAYDIENNHWVTEDVYIPLNIKEELYTLKKNIFGKKKLVSVASDKYVIHNDINLCDKDGDLIFEGDYLQCEVAEDKIVIGLVIYASDLSSYVVLCEEHNEFYTLGYEVSDYVKIIGNVFDGYEEMNENG